MRKVLLILVVISLGLILIFSKEESPPVEAVDIIAPNHQGVYENSFFEPRSFSYGVKESITQETDIFGAVVPHHLLAYKLIEPVFSKIAAGTDPATIILIGPNHYNKGARILTSAWGWQTPFGIVESDQDIVEDLVAAQRVEIDEEVFHSEHSIGNLMPFLKFYLPNTQVVPIILHHDVNKQEAKELGRYLAYFAREKDCLIMASVDFSHYLTRDKAESKDQEMIQALEKKNMGRIFSMGNDYLDSPASIGVLFSAMEELGKEFQLLENTNSGVILSNDLIETTSYITLIFE